jgi:hypothetical protein
MRPLLTPAVRRLWRDHETLQLGRPPGRAVVLAGVDPAVRGALALLDGTRDHDRLLRDAASQGCSPVITARVLTLLDGAGLLDDAAGRAPAAALDRAQRDRLGPDLAALRLVAGGDPGEVLRRRRAARVVVDGAGRVGAAVAALLAAAGVGLVEPVDDGLARPEDCGVGGLSPAAVGEQRGEAARRGLPGSTTGPGRAPLTLPDLVVLAPAGGLPVPEPPQLVPHLLAEAGGETGVVGPLVLPGRSACLRCIDLARADVDPGWPALALQLTEPHRGVAPADGVLAVAVAAQAALQALTFLDGRLLPATAGGTLEFVLPDWRWRRRSWQMHPDCGCGWIDRG